MRRVLVIARVAAVYLLLGFVTTWAVAWGLALLPPGNSLSSGNMRTPLEHSDEVFVASVIINRGLGSARAGFEHYSARPGAIVDLLPARIDKAQDDKSPWSHIAWSVDGVGFEGWGQRRVDSVSLRSWDYGTDDARGFPVLSHWCAWNWDLRLGSTPTEQRLLGGIHIPPLAASSARPIPRALPYYPIWSGLALNTTFYALLFFILVRLTKGTRHLFRFRRGKCPKCGYDMTATFTTPCPECGHAACRRKIEMG